MAKKATVKSIQINHPEAGSTITSTSFVAFGDADDGVSAVAGVLLDSLGKPILGQTLADPPHWAIRFSKVKDGSYTLLVFDPSFPLHFALRKFKVKKMRPFRGISIYYPICPGRACNNFVVYGTASVASVTGTMTGNGGGVTNGTTIQQPNPPGDPNWAIQFALGAAPYDNPYALSVLGPGASGVSAGCSQAQGGITVQQC